MRLLRANDLTFYEPPPDKIPKYAILSHRWMDGEVLYHKMLTEAGKKKAGFEKIKKCGQTALAQGIDYIWVDTCCIDKSSSAELSEAINSMSRWYADAKICYAYLADVYMPKNYSDEDAEALPESLPQSDWFKRGWTLQELIFPKRLLFYTQDWNRIASRRTISKALSEITGISSELLSAEDPQRYTHLFSIAERMSWASKRVTTRSEDLAYCLLGLFDVNMPLLYGEGGKRAFKRLQETIIQKSDDHSLLAWASLEALGDGNDNYTAFEPLADSPAQFQHFNDVVPVPTGTGHPSFSLTTRGLYVNPQIDRYKFPPYSHRCIAWLDCARKGSPNRIAITLLYIEPTGTFGMFRRRHPESLPATVDAARETILLDDFTSYSSTKTTTGPASFDLRPKELSQLYRFQLQEIFPDTGWISKSQKIMPFETSPGDWRFGVRFIRSPPEQCEFALVGGFIDSDKKNPWCELKLRNLDDDHLEALVRAQVLRNDSANHATIRLGEEVLSVEIINSSQTYGFADSEFDLRFRFQEKQTEEAIN